MNSDRDKIWMLQFLMFGVLATFPRGVYSSYNIAKGKPASQSTNLGIWTADKAVDGVIGKDVTDGSCSSTVDHGYNKAWWSVNLEQMSRIKTINVTYREQYPFRLSGFYLYVSNFTAGTSQPSSWHLCYHDNITDPDILPSINQLRPCSVDGRYVIFYNKRPADNGPKNHQYYTTYDVNVELCEVQVYGCPVNTFGPTCSTTCHCGVGGCDPDTGLCDVTGCQPGWKGPSCSTDCLLGTFGVDCRYNCHCLITGCDKETGRCTFPGCEAGWQGEACDSGCGTGVFGKNCMNMCHCAVSGCDRFNGTCKQAGCTVGYQGNACDQVCTVGHFGRDCKQNCHCSVPGCNREHGRCDRPGCESGWQGHACDKACDVGKYGSDCKHTCYCATAGCDPKSGMCDKPGCKKGWEGPSCTTVCNITSFGEDCSHTCHCALPGCDRFSGQCNVTGCVGGWVGPACEAAAEQQDNNDGSLPIGGIIGGMSGAIVAVIMVIIISCVVMRRKRQALYKESNQKSQKRKSSYNQTGEKMYVNMASVEDESAITDDYHHKEQPTNIDSTNGDVKRDKRRDVPPMDVEEEEMIYVNNVSPTPISTDTKMSVTDLHNVIARKHEEDAFDTEYQNLAHGLIHPHETSKAPENIVRNRFKTTFAYDHSRVILRKEKDNYTDYINANYIEDTQGVKAYIATQGPKIATVEDFWRMVWQNECGEIIMLANLIEAGKRKCATYWSGSDGDSLQLGLFQVTLLEEVTYAFYTIRRLSVKNKQTNAKRQITQYHFTKWPDHGIPEPFELLHFHRRVQSGLTDLNGPLIVHCSAGIGRTGTYIGLDALLREASSNHLIDVFAYTERMRKDRVNMIQTLEQYKTLHDVLSEGLSIVTYSLTGTEFSDNVSKIIEDGIVERQFKVLEKHRPSYAGKETESAISKVNKKKNKDLSVLAVENYRLYLISTSSNYINAIKVPSYKDSYGYILTQHPLQNTVVDFWTMVSQQLVQVVVSIGTPQECVVWPVGDGDVLSFGDFTLKSNLKPSEAMVSDVLTKRNFLLQDKRNTTETAVTIIETPSWRDKEPVLPIKSILHLIQEVLDLRGKEPLPIVITCSDGATECGLLCVLCNVVERLQVDGDIDIISTARQLQIRRPQCLSSKAQYEFCYRALKEHTESGNVYVNF